MDMSLDDIIKKNNVGRGSRNMRGRSQNIGGGKKSVKFSGSAGRSDGKNTLNRGNNYARGRSAGNKPLQNSNNRVNKPPRRNNNGVVVDARMKIIQKNRMKLTDAREKLIRLARQTDARSKIKGKNTRMQFNGRQDRGRGGRLDERTSRPAPPVKLQRSIKNNLADMRTNDLIRCTINRPMINYREEVDRYMDDEDMPMTVRPSNDLSNIKVVTQNEYQYYEQDYSQDIREPTYMEYDPPVYGRQLLESTRGLNLARIGSGRMSQEMRARLDTPPPPVSNRPTGLFSWQPPSSVRPIAHSPLPLHTPAPQPIGHRIVVSNLHSSVTHEDIKELFEDIGPLVTSRLVRPGTAEVIYKFQRDAKKAVEAYHNRQLDKQPMKCMLVNARSPSEHSGVLRSNSMPSAPKFPSSSKSAVMPDISAIHKALFMSK